MTEAEWERCIERRPMLEFLRDKMSARKLRLFAVACCRQQWERFPLGPPRHAIKAAERLADGTATYAELWAITEPLFRRDYSASLSFEEQHLVDAAIRTVADADGLSSGALRAAESLSEAIAARLGDYRAEFDPPSTRGEYEQTALLRDIVGNPYYSEVIERGWLTSTVVAITRRIYQSRDFSAMPILADALQDAGCDNADILEHCRDAKGGHVRGCWVVDLVLGKE